MRSQSDSLLVGTLVLMIVSASGWVLADEWAPLTGRETLRDILTMPDAPDPEAVASLGEVAGATTAGDGAALKPHPNEAINKPDYPPRAYFNELNPDSLKSGGCEWAPKLGHAHIRSLTHYKQRKVESVRHYS